MRVSHHIGFRLSGSPELLDILKVYNIPFCNTNEIQTIDIFEDHPCWKQIQPLLEKRKIKSISTLHFTDEELNSSLWLKVRSIWHNGYPQPEHTVNYKKQVYSRSSLCLACGTHEEQFDNFCIKSVPKWGNRHFFMLNWVYDELFVDSIVKTVLEKETIPGVLFRNVMFKNKHTIPNVYQIEIKNHLSGGFVQNQKCINSQSCCSECGITKFVLNNQDILTYEKEYFVDAPEIVKTKDWFGYGFGASQAIIISQRIYRLLQDNNLTKNLEFQPIRLV